MGRAWLGGGDVCGAPGRGLIVPAHASGAPSAALETGLGSRPLDWIHDPDVAWLTGVNEYQGVRYFVKEPFEQLVWWMALPALLHLASEASPSAQAVRALERDIAAYLEAAAAVGYRVP